MTAWQKFARRLYFIWKGIFCQNKGGAYERFFAAAQGGTYLGAGGAGAVWGLLVRDQKQRGGQRRLRRHPGHEGWVCQALVSLPLLCGGVVLCGLHPGGAGVDRGAAAPPADPAPKGPHRLRRPAGPCLPVPHRRGALLRAVGRQLLRRRLPGEKRRLRPAGDGGGAGPGGRLFR